MDKEKQARRISFLLSAFGFYIFAKNHFYYFNTADEGALHYGLLVLVCTTIILISSFFKVGKYVQVFGLTLASLAAIHIDPFDGLAYTMLVIIVILMYKYGMLKKLPIIKFTIYFLTLILTAMTGNIEISQEIEIPRLPIKEILFSVLVLAILIIIFYDEIKVYIQNEKKLKSEIDNLNNTVEQTKDYIEKIEAKYVDPNEAGLTEKELGLLKALCLYRESNTELGKRLGKSPNTVKVQLSKIMNKISVETRHDLINHCRYYFIKNSEKETVKV